jgi:hypothetical protein
MNAANASSKIYPPFLCITLGAERKILCRRTGRRAVRKKCPTALGIA